MIDPEDIERSEISQFFVNSTVLLTGATGFLGQLVLEKLLRSCPGIKKIYVLIRPKKDESEEERFRKLFEKPLFNPLRRSGYNFEDKVEMIRGDCSLPSLGMDEMTQKLLIEEINCVFHFAATVRFDQTLKIATYINVRATKDLLMLARKMKQLKSFVYCSTAYSFCPKKEIDERFYKPKLSCDQLLQLIEILDDKTLAESTQTFISPWPNTYSFTKSVAENAIETYGLGLPVAIIRPSIVICTYKEPLAGWIGTIFGIGSITIAASLGYLTTIYCDENVCGELIPGDFTVNCSLALAWHVGTDKSLLMNCENLRGVRTNDKGIPIVNYVSSTQNPLIWKDYVKFIYKVGKKVPSKKCVRYISFKMVKYRNLEAFYDIIYHRIPIHCVDIVLKVLGKQPIAYGIYKKYRKVSVMLGYFTMRNWRFRDENRKALWKRMSAVDRELYDFDLSSLCWEEMFEVFVKGGRVYLLNEPLDTVPEGKKRLRVLMAIHYLSAGLFYLVVIWVCLWVCKLVFG